MDKELFHDPFATQLRGMAGVKSFQDTLCMKDTLSYLKQYRQPTCLHFKSNFVTNYPLPITLGLQGIFAIYMYYCGITYFRAV